MTAATNILTVPTPGVVPGRERPPSLKRQGLAAAVSILLHVIVVAVALLDLGIFDPEATDTETAIPVEVVIEPPAEVEEAPPAPPAPEIAAPEEQAQAEPEPLPPPPAQPLPRATQDGGEKIAPEDFSAKDADQAADGENTEETTAEADAEETGANDAEAVPDATAEVAPRSKLKPTLRPRVVERPPPERKPDRQTASAAASSKYIGEWVLDPMRLDTGDSCGIARLTARIKLTRSRGSGRFQGELRRTIVWSLCPAEGMRFQVLMSVRGNRVTMTGSGGSVDQGLIQDGIMRLKDAYGFTTWRKR